MPAEPLEQLRTFRLSFASMSRLALTGLGWVVLAVVGLFVGFLFLFYTFSGLPLSLTPIMLALVPSVMVSLLCGALVFGLCWFWARSVIYEVSELGVTQRVGPASRTMEWLQIRDMRWEDMVGLRIFRVKTNPLDPAISVYWNMLDDPDGFMAAWEHFAHQHSVAARQRQDVFSDVLDRASEVGLNG